jgi:hypothetical protein
LKEKNQKHFGRPAFLGAAKAASIAWQATSSVTRHKSLFASFSSEKKDSCFFSEEKDPKRLLFPPPVEAIGLPPRNTGRAKNFYLLRLVARWRERRRHQSLLASFCSEKDDSCL